MYVKLQAKLTTKESKYLSNKKIIDLKTALIEI